MKDISDQLESILLHYLPKLQGLHPDMMALRPLPGKWSKREIMGHLVDSAQNNIRRFILAQYIEAPTVVYDQDKWVSQAGYQERKDDELIQFWLLLNRHIVSILRRMSAEAGQRICITAEAHTLEWLARDYIQHLLHHLHQVLELDPIAYPPRQSSI